MLYNQTFNLDQVSFAAEGIKDAQQTVCPREPFFFFPYRCLLLKIDLNERFWNGHLCDWTEPQYG